MHDDYRKIPSVSLPFRRPLVGALNALLAFDCWRSPVDPRVLRRREKIYNADGSCFEVLVMEPAETTTTSPALIYYHGGAFALSYASLHLQSCERYAVEAGCRVIFVDYRLGPAKPFPHGFNDCFRALEWTLETAEALAIDPKRVAVMGDSAGGGLSAGVAQKALDGGVPLSAQLLIYPTLDNRCATESATSFSDTPVWNSNLNRNMWTMYLRDVNAAAPPAYAAPGRREALSGLPPAYVETAEFDPLRDEGLEYARRLEQSAVAVELNQTSGTVHGYELAPENPETVRSMRERVEYLWKIFHPGRVL